MVEDNIGVVHEGDSIGHALVDHYTTFLGKAEKVKKIRDNEQLFTN